MTATIGDEMMRRTIGGDLEAAEWIANQSSAADGIAVLVVSALVTGDATRLDRARATATTSRDRQLVEIAQAHLDARTDQVDALAREHLVDFPDNLVVAWIAAGPIVPTRRDLGSWQP
jgi:hypothetical protein